MELKNNDIVTVASAGFQGAKGAPGKSAYQVWLALGNTGSEQDFINALIAGAVQKVSASTQIIESDLAIGEGKKILGVESDNTQHEIIGLNEYAPRHLQSEVGAPNAPMCLNSALVSGWSDDPHVKHTWKDLSGHATDERLAWVSELNALEARIAALENP